MLILDSDLNIRRYTTLTGTWGRIGMKSLMHIEYLAKEIDFIDSTSCSLTESALLYNMVIYSIEQGKHEPELMIAEDKLKVYSNMV